MNKKLNLFLVNLSFLCFLSFPVKSGTEPQVFGPLKTGKLAETIPSPAQSPLKSQEPGYNLLLEKIADLQETLAQHYGQLEQIQHQNEELKKSVDELKKVTESAPKVIIHEKEEEKKPELSSEKEQDDSDENPEGKPEESPTEQSPRSPEDHYDEIRKLIVSGDFKKARTELHSFIESHKDHSLIPSAYYWLGETYYTQKNYPEAAKIFLTGFKNNEKSSKANDLLFKLGLSLAALDKKQEACKTFEKYRNRGQVLNQTHKHLIEREEARLGCGQ